MGGREAGFSEGGALQARCRGRGRGELVAPSSLQSCWTCCLPPPLPGCWGRGRGGHSSLFPSHLSLQQKLQCRERGAERAGEGAAAAGRRGPEFGNLVPGRKGGLGLQPGPERGDRGDATWVLLPYTVGSGLPDSGRKGR